jgi:DNA-binding response OmpR family regulator
MRILVAESDLSLSGFPDREFRAENYDVDLATNAVDVKSVVRDRHYDAVILDLHLGHHGGLELLRSVRGAQEQLLILVLASRGSAEDRVQVLDLGAGDLVFKPFAFAELSARVRAVLRRAAATATRRPCCASPSPSRHAKKSRCSFWILMALNTSTIPRGIPSATSFFSPSQDDR